MRINLLALIVIGTIAQVGSADLYDPQLIDDPDSSAPIDMTLVDGSRDREVPIRVYLPPTDSGSPVILFSHGLGGSRRAAGYAAKHWSTRGYLVVAMQHVGSDESVWRGTSMRDRMAALRAAANGQQAIHRYRDVGFVLDRLEQLNQTKGHLLYQLIDTSRVGMAGHSFGAQTTQGVSGQSTPGLGQRFTDRRIDAAVMFSPNRAKRVDPADSFGDVEIPWMLMTGTRDTSPINDTTVADRRAVYPALPQTSDKFELVLHEAEHHAFSDDAGRRNRVRNPNHHRVILALSTAFWDAYLRDDEAAASWLSGETPLGVMEPDDQWQFNLSADAAGAQR